MNRMMIPRRVLVVAALLGAIGILAFVQLNDRVFREAAIDLQLDREDARAKSEEFLSARGVDVDGFHPVVRWATERAEIDFLERTLGLDTLGPLLRHDLALFGWRARFFREGEQVEYTIAWTPDGRLARYDRVWPEAEPGAYPEPDAALVAARGFLADTAGLDLDDWEYVGISTVNQQSRRDYELTWRKTGFACGGGEYRAIVELQGDEIGAFRFHLRIPEEWSRAEDATNARRKLLMVVTSVVFLASCLVALGVLGRAMVRRTWRWKPALVTGLLIFAVHAANELNSLPLRAIAYETTQSWSTFWVEKIAWMLFTSIMAGLQAAIFVAAADVAGRALGGVGHADDHPFSGAFWRKRSLAVAMGFGACVAAAKIGYVTGFYLAGKSAAGAWIPIDIPIDDIMSTVFPSLAALQTGLEASVSEEAFFRLFAIAFLLRFTRSRWLAIVVPAVVWAFLHSSYPQEPIWIRGVELTVVGITYGWIFLRYGLLVTLASHYFYNAFWGCWTIFDIERPGLLIQIALVFVWPFVAAWVASRRTAAIETTEANPLPVVPPASPVVEVSEDLQPWEVSPLSQKRLLAVLLVALGCLIVLRAAPEKDFFGAAPEARWTRDEALRLTSNVVDELGFETEGMRHVTQFQNAVDRLPRYAFRKSDIETLLHDFGWAFRVEPSWTTHWFADQNATNFHVGVTEAGRLRSFELNLPDDAAGAMLEESAAVDIARNWAASRAEAPIGNWNPVEVKKIVRPNRWDYKITFADYEFSLAELRRKITLLVLGDRVGTMGMPYYEEPEDWTRGIEEGKKHWRNTVRRWLGMGLTLALMAAIVVNLVRWSRNGILRGVEWRRALVLSIALVALPSAIGVVNRIPTATYGYWEDTAQPIALYASMFFISELISVATWTIAAFVFGVFTLGLWRRFAPDWGDYVSMARTLHPRHWSEPATTRAALAGLAAAVAGTALVQLTRIFPGWGWPISAGTPFASTAYVDVNVISRLLECLEQFRHLGVEWIGVASTALIARRYLKSTWARVVAMAVLSLFMITDDAATWGALATDWTAKFVPLGFFWIVLVPIIGRQPMAFVVAIWVTTFLGLDPEVDLPYAFGHLFATSPDIRWPSIIQTAFLLSLPLAVILAGALRRSLPVNDPTHDLAQ